MPPPLHRAAFYVASRFLLVCKSQAPLSAPSGPPISVAYRCQSVGSAPPPPSAPSFPGTASLQGAKASTMAPWDWRSRVLYLQQGHHLSLPGPPPPPGPTYPSALGSPVWMSTVHAGWLGGGGALKPDQSIRIQSDGVDVPNSSSHPFSPHPPGGGIGCLHPPTQDGDRARPQASQTEATPTPGDISKGSEWEGGSVFIPNSSIFVCFRGCGSPPPPHG